MQQNKGLIRQSTGYC